MSTNKKLGVVLSAIVMSFLLVLGPASAIQIQLTQPNDAYAGNIVHFKARVDIQNKDSNVPIEYSDVVFTGPNNFSKTCRVYNDGTYDNCDLNLTVLVNINQNSYGYGYGYGYYNGYGYDLGYGYGYNPVSGNDGEFGYEVFGEITYDITWHTKLTDHNGQYHVKIITHAGDKQFESSQKDFNLMGGLGPYCYQMFTMFQEEANTGVYNEKIDLNNDSDVNVVDLGIFASHKDDESWCQDKLEDDDDDESDNDTQVLVCHIPPGNPNNAHTIEISESAVQAHLNHGDYLGECTTSKKSGKNSGPFFRDQKKSNIDEQELTDQELIDNINQVSSEPSSNEDNGAVPNLLTGAAVTNGLQGNPTFGIILLAFLFLALILFVNRKR